MFQLEFFLFLGLLAQSDSIQNIELKSHESFRIDDSKEETLQLGSVTLEEDSELQIPVFKSVVIQKIIAEDGARIRLLNQSSGAPSGDGAKTRFFISEISGHILIEAQGGAGSDGRDGRNGRQGRDGEDGRKARTLFFGLIFITGGEDGHQGEPGEPGEDGGNGADGGKGGNVHVYYQSKNDFSSIVVNVDGGRGGVGGNSGLGGLGGNGGHGGGGWIEGKQGKLGPRGRHGRPGLPGKPGEPGAAEVFQLDKQLFRCLMALDVRAQVETLSDADYDSCKNISNGEAPSDLYSKVAVDENGIFNISADGQAGVDASRAFEAGSTPPSGTPGSSGGLVTLILREIPPRVLISAKGGRGGNGADGVKGRNGADGKKGRQPFQYKNATPGYLGAPGGDGEDGQAGGSGSHGAPGGSGGRVKIVYLNQNPEENWQSHFEISLDHGTGGIAGKAAEGGLGGNGGIGRTNGKDGFSGAPGVNGEPGSVGVDGQVQFLHVGSYVDWIVDEFRIMIEG